MQGRVHSIESLGAHDGPGLRAVVFLQGCPLRCLCCHNPDTWDPSGGRAMASADVVEQVARLRPYFGENGGVTLSGGEPLLQAQFAAAVFAGCRARGIHTALDTSGFRLDDAAKACLHEADLVLLSIKHTDPQRHRELTGHPIESVLAFLDHVARRNTPLWVRHVVLPGWTDDEAQIETLAGVLRPVASLRRVELLPYHGLAEAKWRALGRAFPLNGIRPPDAPRLRALRRRMALALPGVEVHCPRPSFLDALDIAPWF